MKRANGTGTVVKLSGNRRNPWAVKVAYEDRPGLIKRRYLGYYRTSIEAQRELEKYVLAVGKGAAPSMPTVQEMYDGWSTRKYAKAGKASITSYKAAWAYLAPIADKPIEKVTLDKLQAIIDEQEVAGKSKSTIRNIIMVMRAVWGFAMEREVITRDRTEHLKAPAIAAKFEKGAFTREEVERVAELAGTSRWADTVLILCYTGFRIGELLALRPEDYDPVADTLTGGSKTEAGKDRVVPVHPRIKPYILQRISRGGERIITGLHGGPVKDVFYRQNCFPQVIKEAGLPKTATPHWCRHTFATMMKEAGADELAMRRIMGHADRNVTDHYTHVDIDFLRHEIEKVK